MAAVLGGLGTILRSEYSVSTPEGCLLSVGVLNSASYARTEQRTSLLLVSNGGQIQIPLELKVL